MSRTGGLSRVLAGLCALVMLPIGGCAAVPPRESMRAATAEECNVVASALVALNTVAKPLPTEAHMPVADVAVSRAAWEKDWISYGDHANAPEPPPSGAPIRLDVCAAQFAKGPAVIERGRIYGLLSHDSCDRYNMLWVTRPAFTADGRKASVLVANGSCGMQAWIVRLTRTDGGGWAAEKTVELWAYVVVG